MEDGAIALFYAPGSQKTAAEFGTKRQLLFEKYPIAYEAFVEVKMCVVCGCLPDSGALADQPTWFQTTLRWLAFRGILEGPLRGG